MKLLRLIGSSVRGGLHVDGLAGLGAGSRGASIKMGLSGAVREERGRAASSGLPSEEVQINRMEDINSIVKKEVVSVWVRDPRIQKHDFWHTYLDYEICLHTNSMCFRRKTSCVRRRYREFVWLRQKLQDNAVLIELPKLPPRNPFFSQTNSFHVNERMGKLQHFLEAVLEIPLLLSDSHLHLFLQSNLSITKMEACASGLTRYTVAQAIHRCVSQTSRFPSEEELHEEDKTCSDSDCDSTSSSGLGSSNDPGTPPEDWPRLRQ